MRYTASVVTNQLCCCEKVATDNMQTNRCGLCSNTTLLPRAGLGLLLIVTDAHFPLGVGTPGIQINYFPRLQGNKSKGTSAHRHAVGKASTAL